MNTETTFKTGFVAVIGRPNVGKSTLINALMGQKIAAASPKSQTTRRRQLGILTTESLQLVFVDTPGLHDPFHKLGEFLNQEAKEALEGVDVILWLVDASADPDDQDRSIALTLSTLRNAPPVILGLNKKDLIPAEVLPAKTAAYAELLPQATMLAFSATRGDGRDALMAALSAHAQPGPPEFDPEQVTDLYEREIAADLIRESCLLHLNKEVPHSIHVRIDQFTERGDEGAYIAATVFVERDSQKGIVIGQGGVMLKKIGSSARQQIEAMSGRKVFLELRVKVLKDWRNDEIWLSRFGYKLEKSKKKK